MPKFLTAFYQRNQHLKWWISLVLIFLFLFSLGLGLGLTLFGLNYQTSIYLENQKQALKKYVPQEKYYFNQDFVDYQTVVLPQLTKVFNKNCEIILTGLIANYQKLSLSEAIILKNQELEQLDAQLAIIYQSENDLGIIVESYHQLLLKLTEKYLDFALYHNGWENSQNWPAIKTFLTWNYQATDLYKTQLSYLTIGDEKYFWIDEDGQKIFFQGLQHYEYDLYSNYLTMIDAFVSGSIDTDSPILLGKWNTTDLDYLQFLKAKILTENFYFPLYYQAFLIERIAKVILLTVIPIQGLITIYFLVSGWFIWIRDAHRRKLPIDRILIKEKAWKVWKKS